jgi:hypothetical protein
MGCPSITPNRHEGSIAMLNPSAIWVCGCLFACCALWGGLAALGQTTKEADLLPAVLGTQKAFHAACDEWEAAARAGKPTADIEGRLLSALGEHYKLIREYTASLPVNDPRDLSPTAVAAVPHQWSYVGKQTLKNGQAVSYWAGKGRNGITVGMWVRTDGPSIPGRFRAEGFMEFPIYLPPDIDPMEIFRKLSVAKGHWEGKEGDKARVLKVPYKFGEMSGEAGITFDDGKWTITPDRGTVTDDGVWHFK